MPPNKFPAIVIVLPIEYIVPVVNYEIIWKYLDYEFHKRSRPYIYKSKIQGGPSIVFYNVSKL